MPIRTFNINNGHNKTWIDITDPTPEELESVSKQYHINRHIVRDCLDPDHLPKHERLEHSTFIIVRLFNGNVKLHLDTLQALTTKIAIFYNQDFLITIHRMEQPFMDKVKIEEIDNNHECSTCSLVTKIIRHALQTFEQPALTLGEQVDTYEATVLLKHTKPSLLHGLYYLKRKASTCKKVLLLTDDLIHFLKATEADASMVQDVQDLYTKLILLYEQVLDDVTNLLNTYLSLTAQKTNQVMKILTVFSVFFMPLTFIVGVYGMNFRYMPELDKPWGYPVVLGVMALITIVIFFWFKRKKWL